MAIGSLRISGLRRSVPVAGRRGKVAETANA
jgi:hypothetical protein